jgi:peptidoglycan pentaglycine glycine transferase (the first glycine)
MPLITPTASDWDAFVRQHPRAHVLQLSGWATLKSAFGWQAERVAIVNNGQITSGAQLLFRKLPYRLGTLAYLAFGGYVSNDSEWDSLWEAIRQTCKRYRAGILKWEAGYYVNSSPPAFAQWGFSSSLQTIQPPNTVYISLKEDEEAILARMNQGTRRKIRQALKNDLRYYQAQNAQDVEKFNQLMTTTGARNEFGVHDGAYYQLAFEQFVPRDATLILAEHEGDTLAGVFVFALGDTAWYLYGASSNEKRNLMASYGVQWQAIQWAKARGCAYYDMWGIPDVPEAQLEAEFETRNDGLWGVYGFKRGWGGMVMRSTGTHDKTYNPLIGFAYHLALKLRKGQE